MARAEKPVRVFVKALLGGKTGRRAKDGRFEVNASGRTQYLDACKIELLISTGVITGDADQCRASPEAATWLRRQLLLPDEAFAGQHRNERALAAGAKLNLAESPLARLGTPGKGETMAFLSLPQLEAGERVRRLVARAQLTQRVTMSYSPTHTASGKGAGGTPGEIGDMAMEARRQVSKLFQVLPRDCAGVVIDVCGLLKGLQLVETERGWPRRSAKLVLRIGLDQLVRYYGLDDCAIGPQKRSTRVWLDDGARPSEVG